MIRNVLTTIMIFAFMIGAAPLSASVNGSLQDPNDPNKKKKPILIGQALDTTMPRPGKPSCPILTDNSNNIQISIYLVAYLNIKVTNVATGQVVHTSFFDPLASQQVTIDVSSWPVGQYRLAVEDLYGYEEYYLEFEVAYI